MANKCNKLWPVRILIATRDENRWIYNCNYRRKSANVIVTTERKIYLNWYNRQIITSETELNLKSTSLIFKDRSLQKE